MKEGVTNKQIQEARESLRKIHEKYQAELFEVVTKIDKFLEELEHDE